MSKTAAHTKPDNKNAVTRSHAKLAERQNSLGAHVCVQREASGLGVQPNAPSLVHDVLNSPGQPLDAGARALMEPRFGYDFSGVRVHADDNAAESAKAVGAKAYTAGTHVAFDSGAYAPSSRSGQQLIAHELTHVVQQASGPVAATQVAEGLSVSHPADGFEQEARSSSTSVVGGRSSGGKRSLAALPSTQPSASHTSIQRQDAPDTPSGRAAASAGEASAVIGGVSAAVGIWSAIIGERALSVSKDQLKEAKQQNIIGQQALEASEAQPTAVEGLAITHASVADFNPDDKTSKKTDLIVPILQMGIGKEDLAQYRLRLQIDEKHRIRGGTTEEEDAQGYVGGHGGSNASVTFSATQESLNPDQLLIQFRGTNVAPKRAGVQRIHGEVKISGPKWQREEKPLVSHPPDRNTMQAKGPWALIPPYTPPAPQAQVVPAPPPKKSSGGTPKKGSSK